MESYVISMRNLPNFPKSIIPMLISMLPKTMTDLGSLLSFVNC